MDELWHEQDLALALRTKDRPRSTRMIGGGGRAIASIGRMEIYDQAK